MKHVDALQPHYSFTNLPSVFDEEALTALELCARLAAKINETIEHLGEQDDEIKRVFESVPANVDKWLEAHPEVTTTLQDGEILLDKFNLATKEKTVKDYVTPEMFGVTGAGNDATLIQTAVNNADGLPVLLRETYNVSETVYLTGNKTVIVNGQVNFSSGVGFDVTGHNNKITGCGIIKGDNSNTGIKIHPDESGLYSYYTIIDVKEIRNFNRAIWLLNLETNGIASYFNIIDKVVFTECKTGVRLEGWANGNKLNNLCFYNCGVADDKTRGAIELIENDGKYPIENMFSNISTTKATNCLSIYILGACEKNIFSGLQFENGGDNAYGIYTETKGLFRNNIITGLVDINNKGSKRGDDNTIMAWNGNADVPVIRTKSMFNPCGGKFWLKSKAGVNFGDGSTVSIMYFGQFPMYAAASVKFRAMFVSNAAGDFTCCKSGEIFVRKKSDGTFVTNASGGFDIRSSGEVCVETPNSQVGTTHYQYAFIEVDYITTTRDNSVEFGSAHYGVAEDIASNWEIYNGEW